MDLNTTDTYSINGTLADDIHDYINPFDVLHIRVIFTILYGIVFLAAFMGRYTWHYSANKNIQMVYLKSYNYCVNLCAHFYLV